MKIGIPEATLPGKPQPRSIEGMSHLPSSVPSNIPILIGYSSPKTDRKSHGNYYYFAGHVSVQLSGGATRNAETTDPAFRSRSSSPTATPVSAVSRF